MGQLRKAFREATTVGVIAGAMAFSLLTNASELKVLFNHNDNHTYIEPYRRLSRQGDDLETALVSVIESAKASLWIAVQEIRLPRVAKAIAQKHRAGVDVRMVIENSYNYDLRQITNPHLQKKQGYHEERIQEYLKFVDANRDAQVTHEEAMDRDAVYILKQAGVPLIDDTADGSAGSGLMHHKFVVVDNKMVVVTSANFTMSDVHGDYSNAQTKGNANSFLTLDDSTVAQVFAEEFLILWGAPGQKPKFGVQKPYRPAQKLKLASGEQVTIQFSGTSRNLGVQESTLGLILRSLDAATRSVQMALFVFSEAEFADLLRKLHESRSIDIRALIEPTFAYRYYSKALDMWGLQLLPQNCRAAPGSHPWASPVSTVGVPKLPDGDFLHHKFAVIDAKTTVVGSHNWSRAAAEHNDETLMVIESSSVAMAYEKEFSHWYRDANLGAPSWLVRQAAESQARCR